MINRIAIKLFKQIKCKLVGYGNRRRFMNIFSEIYRRQKWGGKGSDQFCSGRGSRSPYVVKPYVETVRKFLKTYGEKKPIIVDLGCGDFEIGKNFIDYCSEYVAVDIIPELIRHHKLKRYPKKIKFCLIDIVNDRLPDGDVCFLRQVLQHLDNMQIGRILPKLSKYKTVFITEHYPSDNPAIIPNKDKKEGANVRASYNSGVYLDKPPFNIPGKCLELVLEVSDPEFMKQWPYGGVTRTYKLQWAYS